MRISEQAMLAMLGNPLLSAARSAGQQPPRSLTLPGSGGVDTASFSSGFRVSDTTPAPPPSPHPPGFMGMHAVPERGAGIYRMVRPMQVHAMELEYNGQQFTAHISAAGAHISTGGGEIFELADAHEQLGIPEATIALLDKLSQAKAHMRDSQPAVYMAHNLTPDGMSWFSALPTNEQRTPGIGESSTIFALRDSLEQATNAFVSVWEAAGVTDMGKETMMAALRFLIGGAGAAWLMRIELDRHGEHDPNILNFHDLPQEMVDQMRATAGAQEDAFIETFIAHLMNNGSAGAFAAAWAAMHASSSNYS